MFTLRRPSKAEIERQTGAAAGQPTASPSFLTLSGGLAFPQRLPFGFVHDRSRSCVGQGRAVFAAARRALERWVMFDLTWVRVANPDARIMKGKIVAVEAHTLGLWTLNLSRIVDVVDAADRFGLLYSATAMHVEQGEERFLIEIDPESEYAFYELEAVSRPRAGLARIGTPLTRHFQHRFARDSHLRMRKELLGEFGTPPAFPLQAAGTPAARGIDQHS